MSFSNCFGQGIIPFFDYRNKSNILLTAICSYVCDEGPGSVHLCGQWSEHVQVKQEALSLIPSGSIDYKVTYK